MYAGGIVAMVSGIALSGIGVALATTSLRNSDCPSYYAVDSECVSTGRRVGGGVLIGVGSAVFIAGIPLIAIGGRRVPDESAAPKSALVPSLSLSPTGGSLEWRF